MRANWITRSSSNAIQSSHYQIWPEVLWCAILFSWSWHSVSVFELFSFSMPHLFSLSASVWWSPGHKLSSFVTSVGTLKNLLFLVTQILGGMAYLGNIANILRQYYKMQNAAWHEQLETWEYLKSWPHIVFIALWKVVQLLNVLIWHDLRPSLATWNKKFFFSQKDSTWSFSCLQIWFL